MNSDSDDVSRILKAVNADDPGAQSRLFDVVYGELRGLAQSRMRNESPAHTLQATALVHEAYLRLFGGNQPEWQNRAHFFGAAAEAMRRILIDWARRKGRLKRGGDKRRTALVGTAEAAQEEDIDLLALDEALNTLEERDPRKADIVKLRYFCGASIPQVAEIVGVSPRTVDADWQLAKAFLKREIDKGESA